MKRQIYSILVLASCLFLLTTFPLQAKQLFCAVTWDGKFTRIDPEIGEVPPDRHTWHPLWQNPAAVTDAAWQTVQYHLGPLADDEPTLYLRWSYEILSDRAFPYAGWNIDDLHLSANLTTD